MIGINYNSNFNLLTPVISFRLTMTTIKLILKWSLYKEGENEKKSSKKDFAVKEKKVLL